MHKWHAADATGKPLNLRHFSGISRPARQSSVPIQRLAPVLPPAISAENLQNMQNVCIFRILFQHQFGLFFD
jgi:hypothetical protein